MTEAGEIAWKGQIDVYGVVREQAVVVREEHRTANPWRWPGQYEDHEADSHYNRFRWYDSDVGRYISQDPIGLDGDLAQYSYTHDPIEWIDPYGLTFTCNRGSRKFSLDDPGTPKSGWVHIFDRHISRILYLSKSKFDIRLVKDDILEALTRVIKHGKESSYYGQVVFTYRMNIKGTGYRRYRVTANPDMTIQTFHPLD
jgi:RHS repeat-associated protein